MAYVKIDMELAVREVYIDTGTPENSYIRVSSPFWSNESCRFYWSSTYNKFIQFDLGYREWPLVLDNINLSSNVSVGDILNVSLRDGTITEITEEYDELMLTVVCDTIVNGECTYYFVLQQDLNVFISASYDSGDKFLPNDHTYAVDEVVFPQMCRNVSITGYRHASEPKVKINGIEILPGETRKFRKGKELLVDARMGSTKQLDNFNLTADTSYDVEITSIEPDVWVHHGEA